SSSFGEFISRVSAVSKIADSDAELIEQQEADKAEVEQKLSELNDLKEELKEMEQLILEQKEANEQRKKELKGKEKE
ncbi:coiled-coil domain-containing protein, partial [Salmonella enterica]|uniref:coiled-coil domain-containing protein n=1 Tax=Salmonella enterica TaxID=28901 RepID=UPI003CE99EF2